MSGFSSSQLKKLTSKLDRAHVRSRCVEGRQLDFIEGWFALSEANAIFGFANWDRETVHFERLFERSRGEITSCAYSCRVRIRVRAGDKTVSREGTGCGTASSRNAADAHDLAIKAAETDATKRALATFGNRFGLCLYDKDQAGVSEPGLRSFEILCPDGKLFANSLSPEGFCTALRKIIESESDARQLTIWHERNAASIVRLRSVAPDLKTLKGEHYADVLERLFQARSVVGAPAIPAVIPVEPMLASDLTPASVPDAPLATSRIAEGPRIDKAVLTFKTARRFRDKAHLVRVGSCACLICGRQPCHAHHIRFAQPRGLSQKVSDEFVVPLCFLHHRSLHDSISEMAWWQGHGIDPLPTAARLWAESRAKSRAVGEAAGSGHGYPAEVVP